MNVARRHLSKGQRAMAAAIARTLYKKYTSTRAAAKDAGTTHGYINHADVVLEYAPDLADAVLAGTKPLNGAYAEAQKRKADAESDDAKMKALRRDAPDLAEQSPRNDYVCGSARSGTRSRR
jgi:hypothetical protein